MTWLVLAGFAVIGFVTAAPAWPRCDPAHLEHTHGNLGEHDHLDVVH